MNAFVRHRLTPPRVRRAIESGVVEAQWVAAMGADLALGSPDWWPVLYVAPLAFLARFSERTWFVVAGVLAAACLPLVDVPAGSLTAQPADAWQQSLWRLFWFSAVGAPWRLLQRSAGRFEEARTTDPLTGLLNARAFRELLERELSRSARSGAPLTLAFIDCDHFKTLNDEHGHAAGDAALECIARSLQSSIRPYDAAARCGGDEFLCLFAGAGPDAAPSILERIHGGLTDAMRERGWGVTFSIGGISAQKTERSGESLIQLADELMYRTKRRSGNAVQWLSVDEAERVLDRGSASPASLATSCRDAHNAADEADSSTC